MINKILGYVLLAAGLVIIGWAALQSYNVFTGKLEPPLVFKTPSAQQSSGSIEDQIIQKQISLLLPPGIITKVLNLVAWSMFALILVWLGGAVSGIGVKLLNEK